MNKAIDKLKKAGYDAYIVGGAVRNMVMNRPIKDIDIVTSAKIDEIKRVFLDDYVIETGIQHGTLMVVIDKISYEITTYRGKENSLIDDVQKRDFTMNSLLFDGSIIDYVGGVKDINNSIIRCNGNPTDRFIEDPLRILRALRFASEFTFTIEKECEEAIYENKKLLQLVAKERIFNEFKLLLLGEDVHRVVKEYVDILGKIVPELYQMKDFNYYNPYHTYDLLTHTCLVIENAPADIIVRLAAFFHDIGKPYVLTIDNQGVAHFYKHEYVSEKIANRCLIELKCDKETLSYVCELILYHDLIISTNKKSVRKVLSKISFEQFNRLIALKRADNAGQNPKYQKSDSYFEKLLNIAQNIIDEKDVISISDLAINGDDILKLGIEAGPKIGLILKECLALLLEEKLINDHDILLDFIKKNYL